MKVLKEFHIGSCVAVVDFKENMKSDDGWRGCYNARTNELLLDPQCGETLDATFLHELVHLIDINYECGLGEDNISRVANGLLEYLRQANDDLDWEELK